MASKNLRKKLEFLKTHINNSDTIKRIELFERATFDFWSRKTWVKFIFVYADNSMNRKLGRVGRISGFRIATRNLDLIPSSDKPNGRNPNSSAKRYYDVTRANATVNRDKTSSGGLTGKVKGNGAQAGQWRSFRSSTFSIMVELWSFEKEKWVDTLNEFVDKNIVEAG